MSAPSAGNEQPWQFLLVSEKSLLEAFPTFHPFANMVPEAPLAIVVCGDLRLEKVPGNWVIDCSAAVENLLIAAQSLGLGAVWSGLYPEEERVRKTQELLELPEKVIPLAIVPVGHPAEQKPPARRFDASRVHHNRFQEK